MDVITIESKAYRELVTKINNIAKFIVENQPAASIDPDDEWVDSYDVRTYLKISERTLQRLRSNRTITYSVISGKAYYTIGEIKRMLHEKRIRCNDEFLQDLIINHKLHVEQGRDTKQDR